MMDDYCDEPEYLTLAGDPGEDDGEPTGSCDECDVNVYGGALRCDQCEWKRAVARGDVTP